MARRGKVIPFPVRSTTSASAAARPAPADERGLVEVHRCDQAEAVVVKSLFESEGIPTLLGSGLAHSVHPFTVGAGRGRHPRPRSRADHKARGGGPGNRDLEGRRGVRYL